MIFRGWSNIIFFIINVTALLILIKNKIENIYIFSYGLIFGIFLTFFFNPNVYAQSGQYWKFGIGYALTFLIALMTTRISFQKLHLKVFIFLFLSALNFYMGFRSLAGVCFLVVVLLILSRFSIIKSFYKSNKSDAYKILFISIIIITSAYVLNFIFIFSI